MPLKTVAISFITGSRPCGRRVLKSPPRTAVRPASSCRIHLLVACRPACVAVAISTPQLLGRPGWLTAGPTGLAAEITGQHLLTAFAPAPRGSIRARATAEAAPDGARLAVALLEEALSAEGVASVAIWLMEPDGGLQLAGEAGLGPREAS